MACFRFLYEGEAGELPDGSRKLCWRQRIDESIKGMFGSMGEVKDAFVAQWRKIDGKAEEAYQKVALKFTPEKVSHAESLKTRAEQGDAEAQYELSQIYTTGEGLPRDVQESDKWVRKAALQGHLKAQWHLGFRYEQGWLGKPDYSEAARWIGYAAEGGYAAAQLHFAVLHEQGTGCPQNLDEAIKWYRKAAEQGQPDAAWHLGRIFGELQNDLDKAIYWYRKAAELGNASAEWKLGRAYYTGTLGVPCDKEEGLKWYRRALSKKHFILARNELTEAETKLFGHLKDQIAEPHQFVSIKELDPGGSLHHLVSPPATFLR